MYAFEATTGLRPTRHLSAWPERLAPRAPYVREGRTLHILDIENLCGGPEQIPVAIHGVADSYRQLAGVSDGDLGVLGMNPSSFVKCVGVFPGCRRVGGHGPDGADTALLKVLDDLEWIAGRFDRVVIGSGDHCFAPALMGLAQHGILAGVVAREDSVSNSLARFAAFVRLIPCGPMMRVAV